MRSDAQRRAMLKLRNAEAADAKLHHELTLARQALHRARVLNEDCRDAQQLCRERYARWRQACAVVVELRQALQDLPR
jgi:hypothetical protein